jgi:hypothetical protein
MKLTSSEITAETFGLLRDCVRRIRCCVEQWNINQMLIHLVVRVVGYKQ